MSVTHIAASGPFFFFFSSQQTLAHLQCRGLICLIITVTELSKNRTQKTGCSVGYISTLLCTDCWSQWIKWEKKNGLGRRSVCVCVCCWLWIRALVLLYTTEHTEELSIKIQYTLLHIQFPKARASL